MTYKIIEDFAEFKQGEVVKSTDKRFGSDKKEFNDPHIKHLVDSQIIEIILEKEK